MIEARLPTGGSAGRTLVFEPGFFRFENLNSCAGFAPICGAAIGECMRFNIAFAAMVFFCAPILPAQSAGVAARPDAAVPPPAAAAAEAKIPDAPEPQTAQQQDSSDQSQSQSSRPQAQAGDSSSVKHKPPPQPKRILGIMPNYRAVSAGVLPPPPTPREAFKIATENSFDYSAFVFVGITSLLAEGTNTHSQLGKGPGGFWGYTWRGYLDKTDGNYWVDAIMPTFFHEDERYYAMGEGPIVKRAVYAASRELITPNYHGKNTFNASEVLGRGVANAISLTYYPSKTQTVGGFTSKYAYAVGRDALTNVFREFWPDINAHVFHHRRQQQ